MRKSEWSAAIPPSRGDYFPEDYMQAVNYQFDYIPECEEYDLFGDGSILCVDTKGHSPGHQSFVIQLANTGKILLPVDAAHLSQYFTTDKYYRDAWDFSYANTSIDKLKALSKDCNYILFGHDPESFAGFKKAPEYYD
jgi:glyoxylase-like metal-dependent hydrolase (beta-lactamase superfamily II)